MPDYPTTPYFVHWLMDLSQNFGAVYNQTLQNQVVAQETYSRTILPNVSLVLDPNAPNGTSLYVANVSVTDAKGNTAIGNLSLTLTITNDSLQPENIDPSLDSMINTALLAIFGAVGNILNDFGLENVTSTLYNTVNGVLNYKISLSSNTGKFMVLYVVQRLAKIILFGLKYSGITANWAIDVEGGLYVVSAILNLLQLYFG